MTQIPLHRVMKKLAEERPVFHSEADFQFAFAQTVRALDEEVSVRLEVPMRSELGTEHVDLACSTGDARTLVELKYFTRAWRSTVGGEEYDLRGHAARDIVRLRFIKDLVRLERMATSQPGTNGIAIILTNDNRLWEIPTYPPATRDHAFRIHQGAHLTGNLTWGTPERRYPRNDLPLEGAYTADWADYQALDGSGGGTFRWLAFEAGDA